MKGRLVPGGVEIRKRGVLIIKLQEEIERLKSRVGTLETMVKDMIPWISIEDIVEEAEDVLAQGD
jgi:hypothetical protein